MLDERCMDICPTTWIGRRALAWNKASHGIDILVEFFFAQGRMSFHRDIEANHSNLARHVLHVVMDDFECFGQPSAKRMRLLTKYECQSQ